MAAPPTMGVTYTKTIGAPAVHRWPGGLVATTLSWHSGLPHDLGHWILEAQVDLPYGFWSLAAQRAPFASFTLVEGRWPKGRQEWLDRVRRKHETSMLHAEAHGGAWLTDPELDVRAQWPTIRRRLARAYAFEDHPLLHLGPEDVERLRPLALEVDALWRALPQGASIEVAWPGAALPRRVPSDELAIAAVDAGRPPQRPAKVAAAAKARRARRQLERTGPRRRR